MKSYQIALENPRDCWNGGMQYSLEILAETPEDALENWYTQHPQFWGKVNFINSTLDANVYDRNGLKISVVEYKPRVMLI